MHVDQNSSGDKLLAADNSQMFNKIVTSFVVFGISWLHIFGWVVVFLGAAIFTYLVP